MPWDAGTVVTTIDARGREIKDTAHLQPCYGMLSMPFQNENNKKNGGLHKVVKNTQKIVPWCRATFEPT